MNKRMVLLSITCIFVISLSSCYDFFRQFDPAAFKISGELYLNMPVTGLNPDTSTMKAAIVYYSDGSTGGSSHIGNDSSAKTIVSNIIDLSSDASVYDGHLVASKIFSFDFDATDVHDNSIPSADANIIFWFDENDDDIADEAYFKFEYKNDDDEYDGNYVIKYSYFNDIQWSVHTDKITPGENVTGAEIGSTSILYID